MATQQRLEDVLGGETRREAPPVATPIPQKGPEIDVEATRLSLPVRVATWLRPARGGDRILIESVGEGAVLAAVFDVAGHGPGIFAAATYLQGWLRGRLRAGAGPPRLDVLADELTAETAAVGIEAAWFLCLLTARGRHVVHYEGVCSSFPIPILFQGDPPRTMPAASPPQPGPRRSVEVLNIQALEAPWKLVVASDGFHARLGGTEAESKRRIRQIFSRSSVSSHLESILPPPPPLVDDEALLVLAWTGWDLTLEYGAADVEADRRMLSTLIARCSPVLGASGAESLAQAVGEATGNCRAHAYHEGNGPVRVSLRILERACRVEVRDAGAGRLPFGETSGGLKSMRALCDNFSLQPNEDIGITVILIKEA